MVIIAVIENKKLEIKNLAIGGLGNITRVIIGIICVFVLIFSILLQGGTSIPNSGDVVNNISTETPIPFNAKIISPNENGNVSTNIIVKGTVSRDLNDNEHLWIFVSDDVSNWWPQEDQIRPSKHTLEWSGDARIGGGEEDIGKKFRIALIIVNDTLNSIISEWQKECNEKQYWPPITRDCIEKNTIEDEIVADVIVILTKWTEPPSKLIWKIGMNEGPPDYTEMAYDEFDQDKPFNLHYYTDSDLYSNFPKEINDGEFTNIYIHYNLSEREADMDLRLSLDTLYATHEVDNVSHYNMTIKVNPPNGDWIEIGEYEFGFGDSIYPEERSIEIDTTYTGAGENIILLENANRPYSGHWLCWDSLKLEAFTPKGDVFPRSLCFSPTEPKEGDTVKITANIRNDGQIDVMNVGVNFYYDEDGKPHLIAIKKVPFIPVSSSEIIYADWETSNIKGVHTVTIVVDPENIIKESDEENNVLTEEITITPKPHSYGPYIIAAISGIALIIAAIITRYYTKGK